MWCGCCTTCRVQHDARHALEVVESITQGAATQPDSDGAAAPPRVVLTSQLDDLLLASSTLPDVIRKAVQGGWLGAYTVWRV